MRIRTRAALLIVLAAPVPARASPADFFVDGSVGVPWRTNRGINRTPTNVMVTPGVLVLSWVSGELGVEGGLAQFGESSRYGR
jgi:hypothetical protein